MKFSCNPTELSDALNIVSRAIGQKVTIPVLEGIKISAEGDTLTLSATDSELYIEKKIKATIKLEGDVVVIGKLFTDFIRKLTDNDVIELEKCDDKLIVRYGQNEGKIQCLNNEVYPEITQVDDITSFTIKECELKKLFDKAFFCYAGEDGRAILKGCLFKIDENNILTGVSLDCFRIAIYRTPVIERKGEINIIVPGKTLTEIGKVFDESDDIVQVNIQRNNIMFDIKHTRITTRLLEGEYMNYERVVNYDFTTHVIVNKNSLQSILERATLISKAKKNAFIKFSFSENILSTTTTGDEGSINEDIPCKMEGNNIDIFFTIRHVYEALSKVTEDFVRLEIKSINTPCTINPVEGNSFEYVVLPIRTVG